MSVAVIGVAGAVVAAGGAAYSSYSQGKAQKENAKLAAKGAGTVPKAAKYKPVDFEKAQLQQIWDNVHASMNAHGLAGITNQAITSDSLRRISSIVPGYKQAMSAYGRNANALLQGKLPFNDVLGVLGDSSARTASVGIAGTGGPASLRDLGISELQGIQTGGGLLKDMVGLAESIDPVGRHMTPQASYVSPIERIQLEMQQNQLIQQSQQSANNLAATGDPAIRAQAALGPQINNGQIIGNAVSSLGGAVSGFAGAGSAGGGAAGASGGFSTAAGAQRAAPYTDSFSYSQGLGYVPKAVPYYNGNSGRALQYYTGGR